MKKCPVCGVHPKSLSHYHMDRKHKDWMVSRRKKSKGKSKRSKKVKHSSTGHYCPVCGRKH